MSDTLDQAKGAWSVALPAVLRLMTSQQRDLFRHELQRFLAFSRFQRDQALELAPSLRELLLQSLRAAEQPPALNATRQLPDELPEFVGLCEHLLACWRDAEASTAEGSPRPRCADGMSGEVIFSKRLGGKGRPGAVDFNGD